MLLIVTAGATLYVNAGRPRSWGAVPAEIRPGLLNGSERHPPPTPSPHLVAFKRRE